MPIYEYRCPKCQKVFEEWVHLSEMHESVPCPECGAYAPRIMSETSFVLKGGGWSVTDYGYRKGVKEDGAAPDAKPESKPESKDGAKAGAGEAKPAAGADSGAKAEAKPAAKPAPKAAAPRAAAGA